MRKFLCVILTLTLLAAGRTDACTNVIVTPGASADGSSLISYSADSHTLFGELYFRPAARFRAGSMLPIRDWDSGRPLGSIDQVARTWQTVGNMNQHQLIIGETTWGGREEQADPAGIMDYGSLIYVTLQRARTAREAIQTIVDLANRYGYPSEGESFSIADPKECWVMDLVGKGAKQKGIVWVARRIPDGYICAHANQARITRFPLDDPDNCLYAPDVISFAREQGWYEGSDEDFSFRDAYNPWISAEPVLATHAPGAPSTSSAGGCSPMRRTGRRSPVPLPTGWTTRWATTWRARCPCTSSRPARWASSRSPT